MVSSKESENDMKIRGNILVSSVMVSIFGGMVIISMGYSHESRLVPLVIGIPGLILSLSQLFADIFETRKAKQSSIVPKTDEGADTAPMDAETTSKKEIVMMGWIAFILGLILLFGFWLGIAVFLPVFLRVFGKESWKLTVITTVCGWVSIYVLFTTLIKIRFFEGFLFRFLT